MVIAAALLARRSLGVDRPGWAALALTATGGFFIAARLLTPDLLLASLVSLALFAAGRAVIEGRGGRYVVAFYLALWLSFQVKGPVGPLVALLSLLAFRLWRRRPFAASLGLRWGLPALAAVSLPWFIWEAVEHPELWRFFFLRETVERVATDVHHRSKWPGFFVVFFPLEALPLSAAALLAAAGSLRGRGRAGRWSWAVADDWDRFLIAWWATVIIFFSLSVSKQALYILPGIPAFVLWVWRALGRNPSWSACRRPLAVGFATVNLFLALGGLDQIFAHWMPHTHTVEPVARQILSLGGKEDPVAASGRWSRALSFYLGKPIWLEAANIEAEIGEERRYLHCSYQNLEGLAALWRSRPRLWVVFGNESQLRALESILGARVDPTFTAGHWVLARNFDENRGRH